MCCKANLLRRISVLVLAAVLGLQIVGCGKKGVPLPPLRNVPATTSDLGIGQQGKNILLDMGYPATTVNGMTLGGIDAVEVYLLTKPAPEGSDAPTADADELEADGLQLLTLRGTELQSSIVGDRIQWRLPLEDPLPEERTANIFAVRTVKGDEVSAFSNRAVLVPLAPPPPATGLAAEATPRSIRVTWSNEGDASAFDVFRRFATERGYNEALARVAGDKSAFEDRKVKYGEQYIYTVRTVKESDDVEISSEPASEVEIVYEDRFPPRLPRNIVALPERGSVRLRWDPSPDGDTVGYIVFRQDLIQGKDFVRLTTDPVAGTEFIDRGLSSGLTFSYQIQAVDGSGNESPRSKPVSAKTR